MSLNEKKRVDPQRKIGDEMKRKSKGLQAMLLEDHNTAPA